MTKLVVVAATVFALLTPAVASAHTKNPMFQAKGTSGTNPLNVE